MPHTSKYLNRFLSRTKAFVEDLEFADIISLMNEQNRLSDETCLFWNIDPKKHTIISKRKITYINRTLIITHLKHTIYASFIKDIYEEFTEYLRSIAKEMALTLKVSPERFVGDSKISINVKEVLNAGSWEKVVEMIVSNLFQSLESVRSTKDLITAIKNRLNIQIDQQLIDNAMPYLDMRHILVHADGKADKKFMERYPNLQYENNKNDIALNFSVINDARTNIKDLVKAIDLDCTSKGLIKANIPPNTKKTK